MGVPGEAESMRRQEVLTDLGRRAIEGTDLDRLLDDAVAAVADALDADYGAIFEVRPGGDEARLRAGHGWPEGSDDSATASADRDPLVGSALRSGEPVVVDDFRTASRPPDSELLDADDVETGIGVAIGPVDDPWGVLGAYAAEPREFATHDAHFLENVANILGSAVETERTRRRLEAEEALTDQIVETSPVGIVVYDDAAELRIANDRAQELLGRDREAIASMSYDDPDVDLVDPNGDPIPEDGLPFRRVMETGEAFYGFGLGLRRPSGDRVWLTVNGAPIGTGGDEPGGAVLAFEDVTEQRRLENELNEVLDRVTDAMYALDEEWRFTYVNDRAEAYLGRSEGELLGEVVWDVFPGAVDTDLYDRFHDAMETQEPVSFERHSEPLGIWAQVNAYPSETGLSVYFRDVSDRKEMEQDLRESEEKFRQLAEHLDQVVWMSTDDMREVLYVNPVFEEVWGIDRERVYEDAEALLEAVHPDGREMVLEEFDKLITDDYEVEYRIVRPDGEVRWIHDRATPIFDEEGNVYRIVGDASDVTERKERELELERYERIVETVGDAIYVVDEDQRFTMVNEAAVELSGYSRDELIGAHVSDMIGPEAAAHAGEMGAALSADSQDVVSEEFTLTTADGREVPIEARFTALPAADGNDKRVGVARDISEQKERERELERALDLLEKTERTADVGGWEIDPVTMDVFWSDHLFDILEVDSDEEPPLDEALDVYHEDDRPIVEAAVEEALETGDPFDVEVRFRTPGGEVRWLRVQGDPETVGDDVVSLRGAAQDITDRKRRERDLEQRARQQQVVADLGQFALETDDLDELMHEAARQVADVLDNAYCKVLDLDPGERELLLRQGVGWRAGIVGVATVDADDNSQAGYTLLSEEPVIVEDLDTETRFSGPELLTSHDVTSGISTIIGSIDEPWGILGTHDTASRDFTEEDVSFVQSVANVLAEAIQRHQYQAELEELVDQLEESNERLEQFAYAASHDLQEPLRMVSSYLQLIEDRYADALDEDGEEFLEFAVDGADRMRTMIDGLLQYSRVETQGAPLGPVDLDQVLDDVLADLQVKIEEHDAEITADDLPRVRGDADQLRQVFQNLLSNAIEYRGEKPPRVRITAERDWAEWVVSVEDQGVGIDPADQERIFEIFQRLHDRSEHPGTGIGLALCERIVERHGGDIWVDSEPGQGATFAFTLQAADADE